MCGRIALATPPREMARLLDAELLAGVDPHGHPSWNVGPTQRIDVVSDDGSGRVLDRCRWGLLPSWAKDRSFAARTFNARAETVATKPSFRAAYKARRALLPIDGFYEWDRAATPKPVPHYFTRAAGGPLVCAGLWESWHDPEEPEAPALRTTTMLTCAANPDMAPIHDRMPVILEAEHYDLWLTAGADELDALVPLLAPPAAGTLVEHAVGREVGNIRNDGPQLIEPTAPETLF
jgi:putative SOS response-associated peptidase YedK